MILMIMKKTKDALLTPRKNAWAGKSHCLKTKDNVAARTSA
jgi:hypothetical protein